MREFAQERRCADDDINTIDTSLDGDASIIHMATDVGEDLGAQTELADGLAVSPRLLRGSGGGELDVLDTEGVQSLGNRDLGLGVEEGIGKLFALSQCALDDVEIGDVGNQVGGTGSIWVPLLLPEMSIWCACGSSLFNGSRGGIGSVDAVGLDGDHVGLVVWDGVSVGVGAHF